MRWRAKRILIADARFLNIEDRGQINKIHTFCLSNARVGKDLDLDLTKPECLVYWCSKCRVLLPENVLGGEEETD
jgi:hypothetical protein